MLKNMLKNDVYLHLSAFWTPFIFHSLIMSLRLLLDDSPTQSGIMSAWIHSVHLLRLCAESPSCCCSRCCWARNPCNCLCKEPHKPHIWCTSCNPVSRTHRTDAYYHTLSAVIRRLSCFVRTKKHNHVERKRERESGGTKGNGGFDRQSVGLSRSPPGVCISGPGSQPCLPTLLHQ